MEDIKLIIRKKTFIVTVLFLTTIGCQDNLELLPPGAFSVGNVLQTESGMTSVLYSAYASEKQSGYSIKNIVNMNEVCTDIGFNTGGGENRTLSLFINFTWDPSTGWIVGDYWNPKYQAIRNANVILDNIENANQIDTSTKALFTAEARYIRGASYVRLYNLFGAVPLRTTGDFAVEEANLPRASDDEILSFIEADLMASIINLPNPGEESIYGRANKGQALGLLTKFYLQTKQWAKVVSASSQLINLGYYELFPTFREMFFIENEENKEFIISWSRLNIAGQGSSYQNGAFPPGFRRANNIPEFEWKPGFANWATQYRLRDAFVNSFDLNDARLQAIIQEYFNAQGNLVNLRNEVDNSRCLKFFDNNQVSNSSGSDNPYIRYSDILLSRAEAMNELNGPTQESLDLINEVRNRANLVDLTLTDAPSKDVLRDIILDERGWEFVAEGKRREDLIRHGKFISKAIERGVNAKPHHILFPIPSAEINANPNVSQNDGY